jgi:hypothetical protein
VLICRLQSGHDYRSLHLPLVLAGDETARVPHHLFSGPEPIGDKWPTPEVSFMQALAQSSSECDEACGSLYADDTVSEQQLPIGDFPHSWGINFGVLGARSFHALKDLLAPYVEFLPLISRDGDFTAFKVLRFVDALDLQKSSIEWEPTRKQDDTTSRTVRRVSRFVFDEALLVNEVIFRVPQLSTGIMVFVTQEFIRAVTDHHLTGFHFTQLWPPRDERDDFIRKRRHKQR